MIEADRAVLTGEFADHVAACLRTALRSGIAGWRDDDLAFDYLCLLFALRATGSHPRPSLILVAYAAAGIIGMIPITPGGLGLVEASLTGLLVLADVNSSQAVLATLTYRIASYWLPLLAGPVAYGLFRLRSGTRADPVTGGEPAKGQLRSEAARSSRSSRMRSKARTVIDKCPSPGIR